MKYKVAKLIIQQLQKSAQTLTSCLYENTLYANIMIQLKYLLLCFRNENVIKNINMYLQLKYKMYYCNLNLPKLCVCFSNDLSIEMVPLKIN